MQNNARNNFHIRFKTFLRFLVSIDLPGWRLEVKY